MYGSAGREHQRAGTARWSGTHKDVEDFDAVVNSSGNFDGIAVVGEPATGGQSPDAAHLRRGIRNDLCGIGLGALDGDGLRNLNWPEQPAVENGDLPPYAYCPAAALQA